MQRNMLHYCWWLRYVFIIVAVLALNGLIPLNVAALPDLRIKLSGPKTVHPGAQMDENLTVVVYNHGNEPARGTNSGEGGFMVDLFITRESMPSGFARYEEHYFDGVLLKGGRISRTDDLGARDQREFRISARLPADIKAGSYQLCARVDPGGQVPESDESNNEVCIPLEVKSMPVLAVNPKFRALRIKNRPLDLRLVDPHRIKPLPKAVEPSKPSGDATRTVLEDGSIVITYPDGSQRRLRPDGSVEYVSPEGKVMVPFALQVQGADLPELPEGLSQWGGSLADELMGILHNLLTDPEMEAFQQTEAGKSYYDLVDWRLRSINFLTAQEKD